MHDVYVSDYEVNENVCHMVYDLVRIRKPKALKSIIISCRIIVVADLHICALRLRKFLYGGICY